MKSKGYELILNRRDAESAEERGKEELFNIKDDFSVATVSVKSKGYELILNRRDAESAEERGKEELLNKLLVAV